MGFIPAHLWYFSPYNLSLLLKKCGFQISKKRTRRNSLRGINPVYGVIQGSIRRFSLKSVVKKLAGIKLEGDVLEKHSQLTSTLQYNLLIDLTEVVSDVFSPFLLLFDLIGLGDEIAIWARKK